MYTPRSATLAFTGTSALLLGFWATVLVVVGCGLLFAGTAWQRSGRDARDACHYRRCGRDARAAVLSRDP